MERLSVNYPSECIEIKTKINNKIIQPSNITEIFDSDNNVQALVGTLNIANYKNLIFKISKTIDYAIEHEIALIDAINSLNNFLPHFLVPLGNIALPISIKNLLDKSARNLKNPKKPCNLEPCIVYEKLERITMEQFTRHATLGQTMSIVAQILCALHLAYLHNGFTHYDLHDDNILIQQCDEKALFLYSDENTNFHLLVPTYGFYPVIIDYGLTYCNSLNNYPLYTPLNFYHQGFQCCKNDSLNDAHHFLRSLFSNIENQNVHNFLRDSFAAIQFRKDFGWVKLPNNIWKLLKQTIMQNSQYPKEYLDTHLSNHLTLLTALLRPEILEKPTTSYDSPIELERSIGITFDTLLNFFYEFSKIEMKTHFEDEYYNTIKSIILGQKQIPIECQKLLNKFGNLLNKFVKPLLEEHNEILKQWYSNLPVQNSGEIAVCIVKTWLTDGFIESNNKIYHWCRKSNNATSRNYYENINNNNIENNVLSIIQKSQILANSLK